MNRHRLRIGLFAASLSSLVFGASGSAFADEGQPTPLVSPCSGLPQAGEVFLFSNASYSGGYCWRLSVPPGESFSQIRNLTFLGLPNDEISSAIVGPGTEVDLYDHHFWGGAFWPLWNNSTPHQRDFDEHFGLSPGIEGFNDKLTSLKLYRI
jgi:hypothetical protein